MNDKQDHRNGDAGIGHIKGWPGMRIRDVQIEKEKIDHVPVKKAIGKISQDPREKKRQRNIAPAIRRSRSQQEAQNNYKRDRRNDDEKGIVASEGPKRRPGIGHVNQTKEIRYHNPRLIRTDEPQNHLLGQLIQCVEGKGKKKNELHVSGPGVMSSEVETPLIGLFARFLDSVALSLHYARNDRNGSSVL
jgi:hypothetical protein